MYLNLYRPGARALNRQPVGSLFDSVFADLFEQGNSVTPRAAALARIDLAEKGDHFEATLEIPGVKKEDIDVKIEGARVTVSAQSKATEELKDGERVLYTERHAVSYARSFELPVEVADDRAEATYENGVLRLVLPKKDVVQAKRLQIN